MKKKAVDGSIDAGIARFVKVLRDAGIETCGSCESGEGHIYPRPQVQFYGGQAEGFRALAVALQAQLPVRTLNRYWSIIDGEPTGPHWQLIFWEREIKDGERKVVSESSPLQA